MRTELLKTRCGRMLRSARLAAGVSQETPDGDIVDPTVVQFYPWEPDYDEWPAAAPMPIGKCMACGAVCHEGAPARCACSTECYDELERSLG